MQQLIMRWENDGQKAQDLVMPDGVEIKNWTETQNPLDKWLDIVQHGLTAKKENQEYYNNCMFRYEHYKPQDTYFFLYNGQEVATVTVICDPVKKDGYIHMVATKEEARGKGIGNLMSFLAVKILKERNMQTAYLTTDDFRIPAIKTYLKGGFFPDLSTEDFKNRWEKINQILSCGK
ncbi:MAG: GNAT family N-acetyltransferase [Clostridia bacterium]|nr:GNAT family N-acetyltransferase [Clostridia bacterium]